jgi:hypothetical protein
MSGDLLVMKMVEIGATTTEEISPLGVMATVYVFYDYKSELFGVRCGYRKLSGDEGSFSYYVEKKDVLLDFLLELFHRPERVEVGLMSFSDLPKNSDDITYDILKEYDEEKNEISCYSYNHPDNDKDTYEDEEKYPNKEIMHYLNIIESVYNDY